MEEEKANRVERCGLSQQEQARFIVHHRRPQRNIQLLEHDAARFLTRHRRCARCFFCRLCFHWRMRPQVLQEKHERG